MNQNPDDLPLFTWQQPAQIVPFPLRLRVGYVRRVAEFLHTRRGKERAQSDYWNRRCDDIERYLTKAGIPCDRIALELADFEEAVEGELRRLNLIEFYRSKG